MARVPEPTEPGSTPTAVCAGLVPLATAQQTFAPSGVTAYDDAGLAIVGGKVRLRAQLTAAPAATESRRGIASEVRARR